VRTLIFTVVTAKRDVLKDPLVVTPNADYVCFTDKPFESKVWRCIPVEVRPGEDPCRIARSFKLLSHIHGDYEFSIWQDAKIQATADYTPLLDIPEVASYRIKDRRGIYDEARVCALLQLDYGFLMNRQVARYVQEGYPIGNAVFDTSIVVRRHTQQVIHMNEIWWDELSHNSRRDQVSFPYALWKAGVTCQDMPEGLFKNSFFRIKAHQPQPIRHLHDKSLKKILVV